MNIFEKFGYGPKPHESWLPVFESAREEIKDAVEAINNDIFLPPRNKVLSAFIYPLNDVKVVILGQDPYHDGSANGLAFSVDKGVPIPKSLMNIYKELMNEYDDFKLPNHGDLTSWCKQGVLLLNISLTVRPHQPDSHSDIWLGFVYRILISLPDPIILMWGKKAQRLHDHLGERYRVLTAGHPSPFSAKYFLGCGHFKMVNKMLEDEGKEPIDWKLYG